MAAAWCLVKEGYTDLDIYEASDTVGGLARSITLWNQTVDIGPHRFFSSDKPVNELWLDVVGDEYEMINRLTRIYYKKKFFFYPLKAFNALFTLGIFQATLCVLSYLRQKIKPIKEDGTFENWVTSRFGKRLFSIFFKTYSEKLWGISCRELDSDFAAQRIKKLSLYEAVKNAVFPSKSQKHKTLVDQFAYPLKGTGMVYGRMADRVRNSGGRVHLNTPIKSVITENQKATAIELENGTIVKYDEVISTMPLTQMVSRLPDVPDHIKQLAQQLKYRNTIIVYLNIESQNLFPDQWIYVHSNDMHSGRITNFRNWIPELHGKETSSILAMEYWCYEEDDFWNFSNDQLIEQAKTEIRTTGLIKDAPISGGHVYRIPRSYPVYVTGYRDKLGPIEDYLKGIQCLHVIGRNGAFKYNNQDHSILMGILAADNIATGARNNLWTINTDYETYQESYVITRTGLTKQ